MKPFWVACREEVWKEAAPQMCGEMGQPMAHGTQKLSREEGAPPPDPPRLFPQVIPASARLHKPLLNMRHSLHLTFMCLSLFTGR